MISLEGLSVGYNPHSPLLRDLDLELGKGSVLALVGRNGSGKSTLIRTLLGLQDALAGEVKIKGAALSSHSPGQRARLVSYVASAGMPGPAGMSVEELVSLGRLPHTGWLGRLGEEDQKKVGEAMALVGLEDFAARRIDRLSDGERQRAMLARALAQDTPLMILDEPAAHLDIPNRAELLRILSGLGRQGKTILFSTHDLETAMDVAGLFWVIHGGKIHSGAPEDLGLAGLFDRIFEASGMHFNMETGRFSHPMAEQGRLRLKGGTLLQRSWTTLALKRIGFLLVEDTEREGPGCRELVISGGNGSVRWTFTEGGQIREAESLEVLCRLLERKGASPADQ